MDEGERDLRKKRRRSVRNLRRRSGLPLLNLDALDERPDDGSDKVSQSEENKEEMFGSMWCESQEPVVKKRRRRSTLFVGLNLKPQQPELEEIDENADGNKHNVRQIDMLESKEEVQNDIEFVKTGDIEEIDTLDVDLKVTDAEHLVNSTDIEEVEKKNQPEKPGDKNIANVTEMEVIQVCQIPDAGGTDINNVIGENEEENGIRISLNDSDVSNKSLHDLSKISPSSMSPDFPVSPSTALDHESNDESYIEENQDDKDIVTETNMVTSPRDEVKLVHTNYDEELIQKSPGEDHLSDLSHSDKENSIVNDDATLTYTPNLKDEPEKVSPGFMSLCKAFAGKVVNFVKTSPSFLTGGMVDASNTSTNICASPALKGSVCENLVSNDLTKFAKQSNVNKSLEKLITDTNKESSCCERVDNSKDVTDAEESKIIEKENKVVHSDKTVEKSLNNNTISVNQVNFGSAKKQRDRKSFFDTFNAVSDELNKDRRKSSSLKSTEEMMVDPSEPSEMERIGEEVRKSLESQPSEYAIEAKCKADTFDNEDFMNTDKVTTEEMINGASKDNEPNKEDCPIDIAESETNAKSAVTSFQNHESNESTQSLTNCKIIKKKLIKCNEKRSMKSLKNRRVPKEITDSDIGKSVMDGDFEVPNSIVEVEERHIPKNVRTDNVNEALMVVVSRVETAGEKVMKEACNSDSLQVGQGRNVKAILKKRKRRALDVPNDKSYASEDNINDIRSFEELPEKKLKHIQETDYDEISEKNLVKQEKGYEENSEKQLVKDQLAFIPLPEAYVKSGTLSDHQKHSVVKPNDEESELEKIKPDKKVLKVRKDRRKSFGVQNIDKSTDEATIDVIYAETDNYTSVIINPTIAEVDEIDGISGNQYQDCHIEKRVAALDLGSENNQETKDESEKQVEQERLGQYSEHSNEGRAQVENKQINLDNNLQKVKRGRRRKSANLNEILKRGRPRKKCIEQVIEEEGQDIINSDKSETKNISELANDISQVQINDIGTQMSSAEPEITVDNLVLPDDSVEQEEKDEPKRRRRRSAGAATLRLQMIMEDQSPPGVESAKVNQAKRGRRKSAEVATLKIQMGINEEDDGSAGDNSPDVDTSLTKRSRKRKFKEDTPDELEKIYRNKNFVKPEEKKPWQTVVESPGNSSEVFGKKKLQRHIDFERPSQLKLRRRLQKAVKNGWDPKKRKRNELEDDFVQVKLVNLWSDLDGAEEGPESLQSKLRSIVETT